MFKAYRFRMYPNDDQKILIEKHIGSCRFVWNHFLDLRNKRYTEKGEAITRSEMSSLIPLLKKEYPWLNEINSQSIQQVVMHLDSAFHGFFKKITRYPRFKKKRNSGSFSVPQHFSIDGNHLTRPKFKAPLRLIMHREIQGTMHSLTISKTSSGKYYVSILSETQNEIPESREIKPSTTVSMDVGITEFITLSNGIQISNPKNLKKSEKKLAKRQRQMAKKQKGSNNWNSARIKVATLQEHVANQRMDFHNRISDVLTRQYDTMITEGLNVSGMMKNHKLAKSIADAGWYSFFTMLKTKALSRGKNTIEIGMFDPSSRMCSHCGYIHDDLKLSERTWTCPRCNTTHDREWNAAINIKRFGLIKTGVPTDSGKLTPVDIIASTISLLEKEEIRQVKWLKQEAPRF
ncbi:MAG: RNA-guided endonuclease TnpB family protein [Cuniculiplasma sp.]